MTKIFGFLFILCCAVCYAQPEKPSSAEIHQKLQKLNFLGSALYIAAHPDDENTRLISFLANDKHARTGYLSLTRGDGGQNLIGPELRELLGVIRTQELIEARKIDGGEQFFSRANDFGFSKAPNDTLKNVRCGCQGFTYCSWPGSYFAFAARVKASWVSIADDVWCPCVVPGER